MNKFDKYLVTYVKYTSLVFILFMIWASEEFKDLAGLQEANASGGWWNVFGAFFIVWVLGIFYIVIKMLFSKSLRNIIMSKMAGIKERDERESLVAGSAAKFSFLSTFAILLFFLLLFFLTTMFFDAAERSCLSLVHTEQSFLALIAYIFGWLRQ